MQQIPGLYIHTAGEKGRGVYTAQKIHVGDVIEVCPVIILPKQELPIIHKTTLHDYYFLWGKHLDQCAIALGNGSLYNHEINPNANFILDLAEEAIVITCIKAIMSGEEITINYHGEPGNKDALWF